MQRVATVMYCLPLEATLLYYSCSSCIDKSNAITWYVIWVSEYKFNFLFATILLYYLFIILCFRLVLWLWCGLLVCTIFKCFVLWLMTYVRCYESSRTVVNSRFALGNLQMLFFPVFYNGLVLKWKCTQISVVNTYVCDSLDHALERLVLYQIHNGLWNSSIRLAKLNYMLLRIQDFWSCVSTSALNVSEESSEGTIFKRISMKYQF